MAGSFQPAITGDQGLDRNFRQIADLLNAIPDPLTYRAARVTSDYTATGYEGAIHVDAAAGPVRITLPAPSVLIPPLTVKQINATGKFGAVTLVSSAGAKTIAGANSLGLGSTGTGAVTLTSDGVQHWPSTGAGGNPPSATSTTTIIGGTGVQSVLADLPLKSTGGINPRLSILPATESSAGSLSAADKYIIDNLPGMYVPLTFTAGRVPYGSGVNGGLTDNANLTFAGSSTAGALTVGAVTGTTSAALTVGTSTGSGAATATLGALYNTGAQLDLASANGTAEVIINGVSSTNPAGVYVTGTGTIGSTLRLSSASSSLQIDQTSTGGSPSDTTLAISTASGGMILASNFGVAFAQSALATTTQLGFLQLQSMAGPPSNPPSFVVSGQIPTVVDSADRRLYQYISSGWRITGQDDGALSGAPGILKADASGVHSIAISGTDYAPAGNYITALTGDVTATGPGSVAATIGANKVTYAKIQTVTAARLLGNPAASAANVSEISIGSGLSLSVGGVLSATGGGGTVTAVTATAPITSSGGAAPNIALSIDSTLAVSAGNLGRAALTGDVTAAAGSNATAFRSFTARAVLARATGTSGAPADLVSTTAGDVLWNNAGTLSWGAIPESSVTNLVTDLAGKVPTTRNVNTTAPLTGGGTLSADLTLAISVFGASGASHSTGAVPDPGASAGTTRFLREDATWQAISAGGVTAVTATAPLVSSGGSTPNLTLTIDSTLAVVSSTLGRAAITGDGSIAAGSNTFALSNIPTGTTAAGYVDFTAISAPLAPLSGKGRLYYDSTSANVTIISSSGAVNHGIQSNAGSAHKWVSAVADNGSVTLTQPSYSDLSGSVPAITQLTGDVTAGPGSGSQVATLAATGVTAGAYLTPAITVDAKGRVTAISSLSRLQGVESDGTSLPFEPLVNFAAPLHAADNSPATRSDVTLLYDATSLTLNGSNQLQRAALTGDVAATAGSNTVNVTAVHETSGPTQLTIGVIPAGQVLQRSGATVIGVPGSTIATQATKRDFYIDIPSLQPVDTSTRYLATSSSSTVLPGGVVQSPTDFTAGHLSYKINLIRSSGSAASMDIWATLNGTLISGSDFNFTPGATATGVYTVSTVATGSTSSGDVFGFACLYNGNFSTGPFGASVTFTIEAVYTP